MAGYKVYYLGMSGRIFARDDFRAETDERALEQAKALAKRAKPHAWELWSGARRVHQSASQVSE